MTEDKWIFSQFLQPDGSEIRTPEDVAKTVAHSATKSEGAELYGVSTEDGRVICYTGNGPTSKENAAAISLLPELLTTIDRLRHRVSELEGNGVETP